MHMNSFSLLEDYIFANDFLRFFDRSFQKKTLKVMFFWNLKKNVKYVFSNTGMKSCTLTAECADVRCVYESKYRFDIDIYRVSRVITYALSCSLICWQSLRRLMATGRTVVYRVGTRPAPSSSLKLNLRKCEPGSEWKIRWLSGAFCDSLVSELVGDVWTLCRGQCFAMDPRYDRDWSGPRWVRVD